MEESLRRALATLDCSVVRGHPYEDAKGHGFLDGQAAGIEAFRRIDPNVPIIVAEAVWQYTSHVLPGLSKHRAPILTVANWSGQWPGLVGMLNLNGSLTKAGIKYSTIWSEEFDDDFFRCGMHQWLAEGRIDHDLGHVSPLDPSRWEDDMREAAERGAALGRRLRTQQAIMGVFDEGCMGMYNAIIPDHLLHGIGVFKERLSQSALYAAMRRVGDETAAGHLGWLRARGMTFNLGTDEATELTERQVLEGLKMYDAAVRMADAFGCSAIGIQYQQGLKDVCPASDLAEGLLNDTLRPPVVEDGRVLFEGLAVPHFNEVDECAGLDALFTNRAWRDLGVDPSTTLHDVRWGAPYKGSGLDEFVWVFEISGAVPPSHLVGGYAGARAERQPPMYFPLGGATIAGISKPGEIVWSRIYVEGDSLHMDIGRGGAVTVPAEESKRRAEATTPQWPMMHAVLYGVGRDQFMAKHKANHIQVAYAPDAKAARKLLAAKAGMANELGLSVNLCGDIEDSLDRHQPAAYRA
jgi:L-fucose isomerase-like protein